MLKEQISNGHKTSSQYLANLALTKPPHHNGTNFYLKLPPPNSIARSLPIENQSKGKAGNVLLGMVEREIKIAIEEGLRREKLPSLAHVSSWKAMGEHYCPELMAIKKLLETSP